MGAIGNDAASSAQLKHRFTAFKNAKRGKTGCSQLSCGKLGQVGGGWDAGGKQGVLQGADSVIGDTGKVWHTNGGKTAWLQGVCGEWLGCISGVFWWV